MSPASSPSGCHSMCKDCDAMRIIIVTLKDTIKRQNQMIRDMGGSVEVEDDPYEDETPLIVWEPKE